jgi:hypothetical protein
MTGDPLKHYMVDFGMISMTGFGDSAMTNFTLSRVPDAASDTLNETVSLLEFDIHYIHESFGSVNEHGD